MKYSFPKLLQQKLELAKEKHLFRTLKPIYPSIDFSSNDYLGFSSKGLLETKIKEFSSSQKNGATGSRLISGNSALFIEIEHEIAKFHDAESALIFNSGYDANLGLLSSVPQKGDLIISDELIHASIIDGIRLSFATHYKFNHNNIEDLEDLLKRQRDKFNEVYIVVESVYSMDGDSAPLLEIVNTCKTYNACLIVDEAHAIGVFGDKGKGLCNELNIETDCFARVYTYGKAMGCHGASIVGCTELKDYLINFSRSFIYTTAMPEHSLLSIKAAYELLQTTDETKKLKDIIDYFVDNSHHQFPFIKSSSAIHCLVLPGNEAVQKLELKMANKDLFVKSIKSPTVRAGQERVRICLHSFNTKNEVNILLQEIGNY